VNSFFLFLRNDFLVLFLGTSVSDQDSLNPYSGLLLNPVSEPANNPLTNGSVHLHHFSTIKSHKEFKEQ
jgi:hypothetical protein